MKYKKCCKCKEVKRIIKFYRSKTRIQWWCKECHKIYDQEYHRRESVQKKRRHRYWVKQNWLSEYKKRKSCKKCGESHPACLVFHHRNPDKKDENVSNILAHRNWSLERIKKEVKKCNVMCANCHRKWHWKERRKKKQ